MCAQGRGHEGEGAGRAREKGEKVRGGGQERFDGLVLEPRTLSATARGLCAM